MHYSKHEHMTTVASDDWRSRLPGWPSPFRLPAQTASLSEPSSLLFNNGMFDTLAARKQPLAARIHELGSDAEAALGKRLGGFVTSTLLPEIVAYARARRATTAVLATNYVMDVNKGRPYCVVGLWEQKPIIAKEYVAALFNDNTPIAQEKSLALLGAIVNTVRAPEVDGTVALAYDDRLRPGASALLGILVAGK